MKTFDEIKNIPDRFIKYKDELVSLLKLYKIDGINKLIHTYKTDKDFQYKWKNIWIEIAKEDGGKLSLTTIGVIIGSSLGGVGIAAMGGAIGIPLALVLGLGGFLTGSKVDSLNIFSDKINNFKRKSLTLFTDKKTVIIKLPKEVLEKIEADAKKTNLTVSEFIEALVKYSYVSMK